MGIEKETKNDENIICMFRKHMQIANGRIHTKRSSTKKE